MQRMHGVVQSKGGRVVVGALIQVFITGTSTPVTIYSDRAGTQEVTQLESDNEGEWAFYAPNGRYDIKTVINGRVDGQLIDVLLHDPADVPDDGIDASVLVEINAIKADIVALETDQSNLSSQVQEVDGKAKDFDNAHGTEAIKGNWADGRVAPVAELADDTGANMIGHGTTTVGATLNTHATSITELVEAVDAAEDTLIEVNNEFVAIAESGGSAKIGHIAAGTGAVARTVQDKLRDVVSVKDFGAKGDNIADDTAAFQAAINSGNPLFIPSGTYRIGDLTGMNRSSFTMIGAGSGNTTLKYIGTGTSAFKIDAFASGSGSAPFLQNIFLDGFTVEGNTNVKSIINLQGLARSEFSDINVLNSFHGTSGDPGIGFLFSGVMLSKLDRLMCSQDRQAMTSAPYEGFRFQPGTRAGVNVGNSSNLLILNCYAEGNETAAGINVGMKLAGADQLVFHGGSPESCYVYGMTIDTNSRMNTFIGVGFENLNSTADFIDGGIANRFTNCYGSQKVILQGRQAVIEGGFYERIQVDAGAKENTIRNVVVNNWATGAGGFINGDPSTRWQGIYDQDQAKFIYPHGDRTGITVGASPFTWANNTGKYVEVVIQSGTATQIRILRGSDSWLNPVAIPGRHLLAPSDSIEVSYSSAVGMSYVPHNGF